MNTQLQQNLYTKYPEFFRQKDDPVSKTCMFWGIECGDGWYDIIEEFCAFMKECARNWSYCAKDEPKVEDRKFEFTQIKEKFGTLRIYYTANNKMDDQCADIMTKWAEWKSEKTCEVCGKPGKLVGGGWIKTLCPEHERKNKDV